LPKFSATTVENGNTVEDPTIRIWSRDSALAGPVAARVTPATTAAVARTRCLVNTVKSPFGGLIRTAGQARPVSHPNRWLPILELQGRYRGTAMVIRRQDDSFMTCRTVPAASGLAGHSDRSPSFRRAGITRSRERRALGAANCHGGFGQAITIYRCGRFVYHPAPASLSGPGVTEWPEPVTGRDTRQYDKTAYVVERAMPVHAKDRSASWSGRPHDW